MSEKQSSLRSGVYRLLTLQGFLAIVVSIGWLLVSMQSSFSALLGGLVGWLPGFYFAWRFSKNTHARQLKRILKNFYRGETIKLLLTALLTITLLSLYPDILMLPFITGLFSYYLGVWFAPWVIK